MDRPFDSIVLIHGMWMTALSWENWVKRYQERGFRVIARSWPGMEGDIEELRKDPSRVASLGLTEIVDQYAAIIEGLEHQPLIMGHSFGGLITQILLDRGYGAAGIAIASAPAKGVLPLPFSTLKVVAPIVANPRNAHRATELTPEQFHYAFTNTLSEAESLAAYRRYAVPGPDQLLFQASLANFNPGSAAAVGFDNDARAPLLMIAGQYDHISPPSVVEANAKLYRVAQENTTEYMMFPDRTHYILGQPGWEEVADFALEWGLRNASATGEDTLPSDEPQPATTDQHAGPVV
jgi:pimeloyl-ACP methyl ester carboxylesterase